MSEKEKNKISAINKQGPYIVYWGDFFGGPPGMVFKNLKTEVQCPIMLSDFKKSLYDGKAPFSTFSLSKKQLENIIKRLEYVLDNNDGDIIYE